MLEEKRAGELRKKRIIAGFFIFLGLMWLCIEASCCYDGADGAKVCGAYRRG